MVCFRDHHGQNSMWELVLGLKDREIRTKDCTNLCKEVLLVDSSTLGSCPLAEPKGY